MCSICLYLSSIINNSFNKTMKFIAVLLMLNISLLFSFSSMANVQQGKTSCCKLKTDKGCCKQQNQKSDHNCAKRNCNAMLSCWGCGFIVTDLISFSPAIDIHKQSAYPFVIGAISDYHGNGWNPPKA